MSSGNGAPPLFPLLGRSLPSEVCASSRCTVRRLRRQSMALSSTATRGSNTWMTDGRQVRRFVVPDETMMMMPPADCGPMCPKGHGPLVEHTWQVGHRAGVPHLVCRASCGYFRPA